jgi:hypothetical protein
MLVECIQADYGFWKKGERYEVSVSSDSNSRFIKTSDGQLMRFYNYGKDGRGYFDHDYLDEGLIKGTEATFRIITDLAQ